MNAGLWSTGTLYHLLNLDKARNAIKLICVNLIWAYGFVGLSVAAIQYLQLLSKQFACLAACGSALTFKHLRKHWEPAPGGPSRARRHKLVALFFSFVLNTRRGHTSWPNASSRSVNIYAIKFNVFPMDEMLMAKLRAAVGGGAH